MKIPQILLDDNDDSKIGDGYRDYAANREKLGTRYTELVEQCAEQLASHHEDILSSQDIAKSIKLYWGVPLVSRLPEFPKSRVSLESVDNDTDGGSKSLSEYLLKQWCCADHSYYDYSFTGTLFLTGLSYDEHI